MEQLLPYVETVGSMLVTLQGDYSENKLLVGFYFWAKNIKGSRLAAVAG